MGPSRKEIWKMFDAISPTYDRVNRVMSLGIDQWWRKKMADFVPEGERLTLLDCATGTGDQMLSLVKRVPSIAQAIGIDLSHEMLLLGQKKAAYLRQVEFVQASALEIPYVDESFDCVTMSFGIRNVTDVVACLKEMRRVLKKGGRLLILECSVPQQKQIKKAHLYYIRNLMPTIAGLLSRNRGAYNYLNETIETFPCGAAFCKLMEEAGFMRVQAHPLTFGAVTIYRGDK